MISDSLFGIVDTLTRYLADPQCDIVSAEGVRERLTGVRDEVEYIQFLVDTHEKSRAQYTSPLPLSDEDFARLVQKHELDETEDGSYTGNYYGIFPNRATVERVLGGPAEQIAFQKSPFRSSTCTEAQITVNIISNNWAQSCGDAYHSPVQDLPSWLADIGETEVVHVEFTDSKLVAFNLPKDLWNSVKCRASAEGLQPTAWVQQILGAYLRSEGDAVTDGSAVEPSQACPNRTPEEVQAVVERIRQRAFSR